MKKNEEIAFLTFRILMMVLKRKKLYQLFRCSVGGFSTKAISYVKWINYVNVGLNLRHSLNKILDQSRNPFFKAENYKELVKILINTSSIEDLYVKDNSKIQLLVTQHTNNLLHCCVEGIVDDFVTLERIGKETFETTCKILLGDDFVDETDKEIPDEAKRFIEAQREFIMSEKGRGIRFEDLTAHKSFLDFMKRKRISLNLEHLTENDIANSENLVAPRRNPWIFNPQDYVSFDIDTSLPFFD